MDNATYATLTRQSGLMREMQAVANNIANLSTTGFRKEGVIFAEHIRALGRTDESLSMASADVRVTNEQQGSLSPTNGSFDFAIEGEGFFLIDTPDGQRLSRAGAFTPNPEGELVTPEGYRLLDGGGSPIFIPPDAKAISVSSDGTVSADGRPLTQIGAVRPADPLDLARENGVRFEAKGGVVPAEDARIIQGFLEGSNVNPVIEVARMIEVQRAYELGQSFLEKEDERIRGVLQTLGR
ncbi:flagellar hook-basal body complex protein [Pseudogemmobacter sp. W21_MBD1_M6]|uniref:flagellar hook-basal body complex protein n=1 Tax=Pseudogemmobacter sp. W21_MBD1_M6 TaxID=3240271 RepID=UPI003F9B3DCA